LTEEDINIDVRLRAINTLNLITSFNSKMIPLIFENLDIQKLFKMLYKQDSRGCRFIITLLKKFYEIESIREQISTTVISELKNIHKTRMTSASLETFMNLVSWQMTSHRDIVFETLFETFYNNITISAMSTLQIPEHTLLRKYIDSAHFPFDSFSFSTPSSEPKSISPSFPA
jgi:hypothetical protein